MKPVTFSKQVEQDRFFQQESERRYVEAWAKLEAERCIARFHCDGKRMREIEKLQQELTARSAPKGGA